MVGDGVTDMQARPPADAFIGYGGVVKREKVQTGADWFITDFQVSLGSMHYYSIAGNALLSSVSSLSKLSLSSNFRRCWML